MAAKNNWFSNIIGLSTPKSTSPSKEIGVSGTGVIGGFLQSRERNPKLFGQKKYDTYEDLASNISVIAASVRYFVNLGAKAKWSVEPNKLDTDGKFSDFLEQSLEKTESSWTKIVRQAHMHRFEGFSLQEMTIGKPDNDGFIFMRSIEKRPCRSVKQWDVDVDGYVNGFIQENPISSETYYIPRWKSIYLVDDLLTDSPEGLGIYRHCVEPGLRLRNLQQLEETGFNRDLRGIPVGRAPLAMLEQAVQNGEITKEEKQQALQGLENILQMQRKGEDTSIILDSSPYVSKSDTAENVASAMQWGLDVISSPSPGLQEINDSILRIQQEISRVFGTESLLLGSGGSGSLALAKDKSETLQLSVNSVNKDVVEQYNKDYVDLLWKVNNFPTEMKPKFVVEDATNYDVEVVTKAMSDLASAGAVLDPSDPIIDEIRQRFGFSTRPKEIKALAEMQSQMSFEMQGAAIEATKNPPEIIESNPTAVKETK